MSSVLHKIQSAIHSDTDKHSAHYQQQQQQQAAGRTGAGYDEYSPGPGTGTNVNSDFATSPTSTSAGTLPPPPPPGRFAGTREPTGATTNVGEYGPTTTATTTGATGATGATGRTTAPHQTVPTSYEPRTATRTTAGDSGLRTNTGMNTGTTYDPDPRVAGAGIVGGNSRTVGAGAGAGAGTNGYDRYDGYGGPDPDPTDAAQVPPSVMQRHVGEPAVEHDDVEHGRVRRNSVRTHQEAYRGI